MATISELGIQIKAITQSVKEVTEQKKIFNSLQLNFDTTKFGNALDPMNNLTDKIVQSQAPLKKWQYDAEVQVIRNHGYKPIRVMFYYPQREQAIRIQQTLKTLGSIP
jgi:hypothetical protein